MIKIIALVKRRSNITAEEFRQYWYEKHAPFGFKVIPKAVLSLQKRYVQNYSVKLGRGEPPFDGVAEICFDDLESFRKWNEWYFGDEGKILRDDEDNFMDKSKTIVVIAEERVIIS